MPISGLIITLDEDLRRTEDALAALRSCPALMLGERNGRWLPLAVEARDDTESRHLHDWMHSLPGVSFVDVVYVHFDAQETPANQGDADGPLVHSTPPDPPVGTF